MCGTACTSNAEEPAKRNGITEEQPYENYIHRHDFWKSGRSNSTASYCKHQKNPGATCAVKKSTAKWMEYEYNRLYLNGENSGSKSRRTRCHGRRQEPNDRRAVGLDNRADCVTITAWDVPSQGVAEADAFAVYGTPSLAGRCVVSHPISIRCESRIEEPEDPTAESNNRLYYMLCITRGASSKQQKRATVPDPQKVQRRRCSRWPLSKIRYAAMEVDLVKEKCCIRSFHDH
ncbi:N-acylneuraminate cytidylyltransferase [Trichinella pseudospiralis]